MARTTRSEKVAEAAKEAIQPAESASSKRAADGVKTVGDFSELMSTMMADVLSGALSPAIANSVCRAGQNLLKAAEMQHKYGNRPKPVTNSLSLVG